MKKIILLFLLIGTTITYGQTTLANKLKITSNVTSTTATKVNVQEADGIVNTKPLSDFMQLPDIAGKENQFNKQNSLATDGTSVKYPTVDAVRTHTTDINNPHSVTKTQVGLGNVDNTSDLLKPISTATQTSLDIKVDKVTGKSLLSDAEITRLTTLENYTHPTNHPPSIITQDVSNRFVTDAEKSAWNAKQSTLGYTAENLANKGIENGYASLDASGKVPLIQISDALLGSVNYKGTYNASTNVPALATPASGNKGFYFIVSTAGTQVGLTLQIGDWVISNGVSWGKVDNNNAVTSVNGLVGSVALTTSNIAESTNKRYQTDTQQTNNDAISPIQAQINSKAPLASPTLTGVPTAPTAVTGTNTTQLATTAFVMGGIATADAGNAKLASSQTFTGGNVFNTGSVASSIVVNGTTGNSVQIGITSGNGIFIDNATTGNGIVSDSRSGATGFNYVGRNAGVNTFTVNKLGTTTATSFINSTAPATNALLAGGTTLAVAPSTGGAGYIQNQNSSAQSANMWISGSIRTNLGVTLGKSDGSSSWTNYIATDGSNKIYSNTLAQDVITLGSTGAATFSSSVTASNFKLSNAPNFNIAVGNGDAGTLAVSTADIVTHNGFGIIASAGNAFGDGTRTIAFDARSGHIVARGNITATAHITTGGTSSQFVKGDGSLGVAPDSRPYKVYTASLFQTGTSNPSVTVMENSIGNIIWTRSNTGLYTATLTGAFTTGKVACFITPSTPANLSLSPNNTNSVTATSLTTGSVYQDNLLSNTTVEIRVYN